MGVLSKGTTFVDGTQVTSTKLNNLVDDAVFTASAVDDTTTQLSSGKIVVKTVGTGQLATNAVTTAKITDANVTEAKLAADSVSTAKIQDDAVTTVKIADANVTASKMSGAQSGSAPVFGVRAYGSFNGTAASPITPVASGNIASIVRVSTGNYTVTLTTPMADSNYTVVANATHAILDTFSTNCYVGIIDSSSFSILTGKGDTETFYNSVLVSFVVIQ